MKTCGSGGIAWPFLTSTLDISVWPVSHSGRFTSWGRAPPPSVLIGWEAGLVPEPVWTRQISCPARNRTSAVQPVAPRFTYRAIPPAVRHYSLFWWWRRMSLAPSLCPIGWRVEGYERDSWSSENELKRRNRKLYFRVSETIAYFFCRFVSPQSLAELLLTFSRIRGVSSIVCFLNFIIFLSLSRNDTCAR
jgi:hypothetical protein